MTAHALPASERQRLLRVLGVMPLMLRHAPAALSPARVAATPQPAAASAAPAPITPAASADATSTLALIVLLPPGAAADARQQALLRAALLCLPAPLQRAPCIELAAHGESLPAADAYLALGAATLADLGSLLPLDVQQRACIAGAATPAELLREPARKRELWRALKQLRRAARGAG